MNPLLNKELTSFVENDGQPNFIVQEFLASNKARSRTSAWAHSVLMVCLLVCSIISARGVAVDARYAGGWFLLFIVFGFFTVAEVVTILDLIRDYTDIKNSPRMFVLRQLEKK